MMRVHAANFHSRAKRLAVLVLLLSLVGSCGGATATAPAPCLSDSECRFERVCHEGRCRFVEEVREELNERLDSQHNQGSQHNEGSQAVTAGGEEPISAEQETTQAPTIHEGPTRTGIRGPRTAPPEVWRSALPSRIYAPLTIDDDCLLVASSDGTILSLRADGRLRFRIQLRDRFYGPIVPDGNGILYLGGHSGTLYAIGRDGRVIRTRALSGPIDGAPLIDPQNHLVWVASDALYALDSQLAVRARISSAGALSGSPAWHQAGFVVATTATGKLLGVNPDGVVRFEVALAAGSESTPVVSAAGEIFVGSDVGFIQGFSATGAEIFRVRTEGDVRATPALLSDGSFVVGSDDRHIYRISAAGEVLFRLRTGGRVRSLARVDAEDVIYVGSQDDSLYALRPNGELLFRLDLGHDIDSGIAYFADGTLVVATNDGTIRAFREPAPREAASREPASPH